VATQLNPEAEEFQQRNERAAKTNAKKRLKQLAKTVQDDDVEDSSLEEGTYIIRPSNLLVPKVGITGPEELCNANSCQAPQGHNSQAPNAELPWVQCDSPRCRKCMVSSTVCWCQGIGFVAAQSSNEKI
ncbi:Hypothetical predicted protein, partial [Paramuricea clavata]